VSSLSILIKMEKTNTQTVPDEAFADGQTDSVTVSFSSMVLTGGHGASSIIEKHLLTRRKQPLRGLWDK
jgi:hypothetical protein